MELFGDHDERAQLREIDVHGDVLPGGDASAIMEMASRKSGWTAGNPHP
jgi:hypothetical protein